MKKCLLPLLFCLTSLSAKSQLGITAFTTLHSLPAWQVVVENYVVHRHINFLQYGTTATLDYLLPENFDAWRFAPAIFATRATVTYSPNEIPHHFEVFAFGIQGEAGFNPFAFAKNNHHDREAPYFHGIFLCVSPGVSFVRKVYDQPVLDGEVFNDEYKRYINHTVSFNIGGSLICDFQVSDFLSLAPIFGIRFFPELTWQNFTSLVSEGSMTGTFDKTTWRQYNIGLRIGLNLKKS